VKVDVREPLETTDDGVAGAEDDDALRLGDAQTMEVLPWPKTAKETTQRSLGPRGRVARTTASEGGAELLRRRL
jgi:hypothetical protein